MSGVGRRGGRRGDGLDPGEAKGALGVSEEEEEEEEEKEEVEAREEEEVLRSVERR